MAVDFEAFYEAVTMGERDTVEAMLAKDPTLARASDAMGFTALHGIVGEDEPELAELLIDRGADVAARNDMGMTPLHIAQECSIVEVLVRRGADVNARADNGWTPLHVQAQEGDDTGALEVMEALLEAGANPNLTDEEGNTPMTFALERDEPEKIAILKAHGGVT
jgi:ankyrin repeat protein